MGEETELTFCGKKFTSEQVEELKYIGKLIGKGATIENIEKSWNRFVETSLAELAKPESPDLPFDITSMVLSVLEEAYSEMNEALHYYSEKVKHFNEVKEDIREHLDEMRKKKEKLISKLEQSLETAGDDAQLANIDLQNALQKQQLTLQTMSNVSKMLHCTAMSIIRKIG